MSRKVAIIGAGMSGLACARQLTSAGLNVELFDKSRGPSGRLSTRRRDSFHWDHGAPFFEARHPDFQAQCADWESAGVVVRWGRSDTWVGAPRMSALGRHLAHGLSLRTGCRVERLLPAKTGTTLLDISGADLGTFEQVVVAVPAPQAAPLLAVVPSLQDAVRGVQMAPSHALLVALSEPLSGVDALLAPARGPLRLLVRNTAKPGRPEAECWVAHTTNTWSQAHLEQDTSGLVDELMAAFCEQVGRSVRPLHAQVHRWRFARAWEGDGVWDAGFGLDPAHRVGVCGDWCAGGGVEAAWSSGRELARKLIATEAASWS